MNGATDFFVLARVFGYLLNLGMFFAIVLSVRRHWLILIAWGAWLVAQAAVALLHFAGDSPFSPIILDFFSTPLLYLTTVAIAVTLLRYRRMDK